MLSKTAMPAVPATCGDRPLARLVADARDLGMTLDPHPAGPGDRAELVRTMEVRAALMAVPEGAWRVPLGLATRDEPRAATIYLETLRPSRVDRDARRVWLQPEDDVPHIRDQVVRLRDALGLRPAQVGAASLVSAAAEVLGSTDLLLCSRVQADQLGLHWRPMGELDLVRGYDVAAALREDADRIRALPIGPSLGEP